MQEDKQKLLAIKSQTLTQIEEVRAAKKPTYWIDGQRVHWEQYVDALQRTVDWCDEKLHDLEPFEIQSQGGA